MNVKDLLQLLQKVENKDINLQYVGVYGNTFPITEVKTEFDSIVLVTGSTGTLSMRKLVKYLLAANKNTLVSIKLENINYRCIQGVLPSGSIRILPIVIFEVRYITKEIRKYICPNCINRRCERVCSTAIHQYCDMYGYKLLL